MANRYTVGHLKYTADVTMNAGWREGLDDPQYIVDRLNHMFQHMVDFIDKGDEEDDNLAGVVWGAAFLMEVERMHPELLKQVIGQSRFSGEEARKFQRVYKEGAAGMKIITPYAKMLPVVGTWMETVDAGDGIQCGKESENCIRYGR